MSGLVCDWLGRIAAAETQNVWWIDGTNGKPTNSGFTSGAPVDSWATLASRYTAGVPGAKPFINPTGGTLTINVVNSTPTSDPACVLLNANYAAGVQVNIVGGAQTPSHTGTLTTVSTFARTSAGGKISITDSTVANFQPSVPSLLVDTTSNAVGLLCEPHTGSGATGNVSVGYSPQTVGGFPVPSHVNYSAGDSYQLVPLVSVYLGSLITVNSFPALGASAQVQISFYRLHFSQAFSGDSCSLNSPNPCTVAVQECVTDVQLIAEGALVVLAVNVGNTSAFTSYSASGSAQIEVYGGGFGYAGATCFNGGTVLLDQDFALYADTGRPHIALQQGNLIIGQSAAWVTGGGGEAIAVEGGNLVFAAEFATAVFYGNCSGAFVVVTYVGGQQLSRGTVRYPLNQAVNTFQFNGTPTIALPSTPFSPNVSTGAYVGPTTATAAHLDAAQAAGTGLAGNAVDLRMGCTIVGT